MEQGASECVRCAEKRAELGTNKGGKLHTLRALFPEAVLTGIEINPEAAAIARQRGGAQIIEASILDYEPTQTWDMVFTSGVLIHINPAELATVYSLMDKASARYVCMMEYYNPSPVTVPYRGTQSTLFKRDFAGEFMDAPILATYCVTTALCITGIHCFLPMI